MGKIKKFENLRELIKNSAREFCDFFAFQKGANPKGKDITYKTFDRHIDSFGTALVNLGLKDKYVAVISENRYEWALSYLAVANGTGVIVPIDCELSSEEIADRLNTCSASAIIYSQKVSEKVKEAITSVNSMQNVICMDEGSKEEQTVWSLIKKGEELLNQGNTNYINADIDNEKMAFLLFTSGTTGSVKGVMLSHKNISSNVNSIRHMVRLYTDDRLLSILPLHHTYECTCGFLTPISCGSTISYCRGLRYIASDIKKVKPTMLVVVPLIAEKTYAKILAGVSKKPFIQKAAFNTVLKLSPVLKKVIGEEKVKKVFEPVHQSLGGSLRIIITGASHISPSVVRGFINMGVMVIQGYGLTECAPLVIGNNEREYRCSSLGKPIPEVKVKIDSIRDNQPGEILVKGPNVMLGYFNDPEKTSEVFADGWFKTGDMAIMKRNGFVYMTGRKKNIIVTKNGENVYPEEIESLLCKSGLIMESVVTSNHNRIKEDNSILAIIVPDMDKIKDFFKKDHVSESELNGLIDSEVKRVNKQMPVYKRIRNFKIRMNEFQKTTTKKIQRHKVSIE